MANEYVVWEDHEGEFRPRNYLIKDDYTMHLMLNGELIIHKKYKGICWKNSRRYKTQSYYGNSDNWYSGLTPEYFEFYPIPYDPYAIL